MPSRRRPRGTMASSLAAVRECAESRENELDTVNRGLQRCRISPELVIIEERSTRSGRRVNVRLTGRDPAALHLPSAIIANQIVKGYPIFNIGQGLPTIGSSFQKVADDLHAAICTLTKLVGAHSLKFGVDFRLTRINQLTPGNAAAGVPSRGLYEKT